MDIENYYDTQRSLIGDRTGMRNFQSIISPLDGAQLEPKAILIIRPNFGFSKIVSYDY